MLVLGAGKFEITLIVQASLVPKCTFSSSGQLRLETLRLGLNYQFYSVGTDVQTDTCIATHYRTSVHRDSCLVVTTEGGADG